MAISGRLFETGRTLYARRAKASSRQRSPIREGCSSALRWKPACLRLTSAAAVPTALPRSSSSKWSAGFSFPTMRPARNPYRRGADAADLGVERPIKSYLLKCSGELERARDLIVTFARGNTSCAHATAIAMENIVNAIERMRQLAQTGDDLQKLSPQEAIASTLRAPKQVVRETRDGGRVYGTHLGARTLVILRLETARRKKPEAGIEFFAKGWNQCPAHAIVPALLAEVWKKAKAGAKTA